MSNMGRLILHPVVDQQKCFTVFPIRYTGGKSQFNFSAQSNVNTSTPSVSRQIYFDFIVFPFFSEAILFIVAMFYGEFSKYGWCYKPIMKDYDFYEICLAYFFYFLWESKKYQILYFT